jgi:ribosome recycling factor
MIEDILLNIEKKMESSVDVLNHELATIRTGRATPGLVDHIRVDYAGVPTPLNQLSTISVPEARLIVIQPWDKSCIREIEKAIMKSDIGLTPNNDGNIIRLSIPILSDERRQDLIKLVHRRLEDGRVAIRNLRRDAHNGLKKMEKGKEISQDELKRAESKLQALTDVFIANAEKAGQTKEAQLKEV